MRRWAGRAMLVAACWFVLGTGGLALGLGLVAADLLWAPRPRLLLAVAAVLVATLPLLALIGGLPDRLAIGPRFAVGHGPANLLAGVAVVLLVVGTVRDVRGEARS
jgi:hypothetical protein